MPLPFHSACAVSWEAALQELAHPKYRWEQEDDQTAGSRAQPLQGPLPCLWQVRSTGAGIRDFLLFMKLWSGT